MASAYPVIIKPSGNKARIVKKTKKTKTKTKQNKQTNSTTLIELRSHPSRKELPHFTQEPEKVFRTHLLATPEHRGIKFLQ